MAVNLAKFRTSRLREVQTVLGEPLALGASGGQASKPHSTAEGC